MLILDTSVLIDLENKKTETLSKLKNLSKLYPSPPRITFMNYFEFLHGIMQKNVAKKETAVAFIELFEMLQPTKKTAKILSDLKEKYDKKGKPLPLADFLIASQAIENSGFLVTKDKDFESIEEVNRIFIE